MTRKASALKHFKQVDPHFYKTTRPVHGAVPHQLPQKRTSAQLFESLVSIVISQQLGVAAADSIFGRVKKVCKGRITPDSVLKTSEKAFRGAGLSGAKIKTIKTIATEVKKGRLHLLSLKKIPEPEAAEALLSIWGLGPWSVEMFMMFGLGRSDVFSAGDLGLVRAMEMIYNLPRNSPPTSLLSIAEKWSPHRTYASLLLWKLRDTRPFKNLKY